MTFTPDDDGTYVVSVIVTDGAGATATDAKNVVISNVAPLIVSTNGPTSQLSVGTPAAIAVGITDSGAADTHTATFAWGDGSSSTVNCGTTCTAAHAYTSAGIYDVTIVVADDDGGVATTTSASVIVYDVNAGHVTGGGWFSTSTGKANVNINVKYLNGSTPTGNVKFDVAGVSINSTSFDWLVVSGSTAQVRGSAGNYAFVATATDAASDAFRIKIWDVTSGAIVYDTVTDRQLGGGSIVIHKAK
jgi:hypothetical protein